MQVRHGFTAVAPVVDHQTVSGIRQSQSACHVCSFQQQMAEHCGIVGSGFMDARDRLFRDDEHVGGGLWLDVAEGQHMVVLIDDVRRNLAGDDAFEECHRPKEANPGVEDRAETLRRQRWPQPGLLHEHGTPASFGLLLETFAEEGDDLFLQSLAALGPPPGAGQLLHTPAQALELDGFRGVGK